MPYAHNREIGVVGDPCFLNNSKTVVLIDVWAKTAFPAVLYCFFCPRFETFFSPKLILNRSDF